MPQSNTDTLSDRGGWERCGGAAVIARPAAASPVNTRTTAAKARKSRMTFRFVIADSHLVRTTSLTSFYTALPTPNVSARAIYSVESRLNSLKTAPSVTGALRKWTLSGHWRDLPRSGHSLNGLKRMVGLD